MQITWKYARGASIVSLFASVVGVGACWDHGTCGAGEYRDGSDHCVPCEYPNCVAPPSPPSPPCSHDTDCSYPQWQRCSAGTCVARYPACSADTDCLHGYVCSSIGSWLSVCAPRCDETTACAPPFTCNNGPSTSTGECVLVDDCSSTAPCEGGAVCAAFVCASPCGAGGQCADGQVCQSGGCLPDRTLRKDGGAVDGGGDSAIDDAGGADAATE